MDDLMYNILVSYFKGLSYTGYKSYDYVYKLLIIDFIYDITNTELRYYLTNKDIKLMQDLLYQLFGSTCEISFPTNNRPCCICVCCDGSTTTPIPSVEHTAYYGFTNTDPQEFKSMSVSDIFKLSDTGNTEFKVRGNDYNSLTIKQNSKIHYLLIPEGVELGKCGYNLDTAYPTILWDPDNTKNVSYFSSENNDGNVGGEYQGINYKVYFCYSPTGGLGGDTPITISMKNK